MAMFDSESICVQEDKFYDTDTTWIVKYIPISVSISSNLTEDPMFLCHSNPKDWKDLADSFVDALDGSATQSEAETKLKFLKDETSVKSKHNQKFSTLIQSRCRKEPLI